MEVVALGVQFISKEGARHMISAKKEVILSASVINDPQLLELSGIRDAHLLGKCGIEVLVDNSNVEENLQNHASIPVSFEVKDNLPTSDSLMRDPSRFVTLMEMYERDRSRPLGGYLLHMAQTHLKETFGPEGSFRIFCLKWLHPTRLLATLPKRRRTVLLVVFFPKLPLSSA